jgi:rhodanese-related sulfurtransferase
MFKKSLALLIIALVAMSSICWAGEAEAPTDKKLQTTLGKYINPEDAYYQWKENPDSIGFLDVRIPEEYYFVGHPEMAVNIPFLFSTGKLIPKENKIALKKNENFVEEVKKVFKPEDKIVVFCRSGVRAAKAVNALAKAGYKNVYSLIGAFEGAPVTNKDSYYYGKRKVNGWVNSPAPWTYDLKEELVYETKD